MTLGLGGMADFHLFSYLAPHTHMSCQLCVEPRRDGGSKKEKKIEKEVIRPLK